MKGGAKLEEENKILRRLLWTIHSRDNCNLYGDDGEMQCNTCVIDFKRDSAEKIDKRFFDIGVQILKDFVNK